MIDKERADTYKTFLNRLYLYRNITMDNARIQQWLEKLDAWGRAGDDQMIGDQEWRKIMDDLAIPEGQQHHSNQED